MKHEPMIDGESPEGALAEFVRQVVAGQGVGARVDLATFSGKDSDWKKSGDSVFLRLRMSRITDDSGTPHELWCRLFAPAGIWVVPRVETEMLCIHGEGTDGTPGTGWCMHKAQLGPKNLSRDVAYWVLPDETTMAATAGGWVFKGAHASLPMITVDKATGKIVIGFANGTHIALDENTIELVVAAGGTLRTMLKLDATKVQLGAAHLKKHLWTWDGDGDFVGVGTGRFYATYPGGGFGKAPTSPVVALITPPGSPGATLSWGIDIT